MSLPRGVSFFFHDQALPACEERRRLIAERLVHEDYPSFARALTRTVRGVLGAGRPRLDRLTQPTLLVWGREDRLVGLASSRRLLREVRHARLAVLERCGHVPMLEQPERFNACMGDFLRAVEAAPLRAARRVSGGA